MYYTYKKNERFKYVDAIDALFADANTIIPTSTDGFDRYCTKVIDILDLDLIKVSNEQLIMANHMLKNAAKRIENPEEQYIEFKIPKKTTGFRNIKAPKPQLKQAQKEASGILQFYLKMLPHDSAWAYIHHRDVVGAVNEHTKNKSKWYLKIDLKDFFGSCNAEFIQHQLDHLYPISIMPDNLRKEFIDNLLYLAMKDGGLPQGTPLSPCLTNYIMVEYDYKINKLLNKLVKQDLLPKQRYVYTRYADDIIISAKCSFDFQVIINELEYLFKETPLVINKAKTRYGSSAGRNWNLGIMCNKNGEATVGYKRKREIKAAVHNYYNSRDTEPWCLTDLQWLLGQLSWLQNVEPNYFEGFMSYLNNKYNINIRQTLIKDIKDCNN